MALSAAASKQCQDLCSSDGVDCTCDDEKLRAVRTYLHECFPDHPLREFHSHSTVVVKGSLPAPCANYHVVSISDDLPCCAVLTRRFLAQPASQLCEHLRGWDLAQAMQVDRTVIVDADGLSPL